MKTKFLLTALAVAGSLTLSAQNLLKNGGFEDDYVPFTYNGQKWNCPEYIDGWDKTGKYLSGVYTSSDFNNDGLSKWNLRAEMRETGGSEPWMTDDNYYFLHLQRFEDNGWYDGGVYQTVQIIPGKKYDFSFYYKTNPGTVGNNGKALITYARIYEYGDNLATTDKIEKGVLLKEFILPNQVEWTKYEQTNIDLEGVEKIVLFLGINSSNVGAQAKTNTSVYAQFDEVVLKEAGASGISQITGAEILVNKISSGIEVTGLKPGMKVNVFNTGGVQIAGKVSDSDKLIVPVSNLKGVYIVKAGDVSFKVIF